MSETMDRGTNGLQSHLSDCTKMEVSQTRRGWRQVIFGCEARTEFKYFNTEGTQIAHSLEDASCCCYLCCNPCHPFTKQVKELNETAEVLTFHVYRADQAKTGGDAPYVGNIVNKPESMMTTVNHISKEGDQFPVEAGVVKLSDFVKSAKTGGDAPYVGEFLKKPKGMMINLISEEGDQFPVEADVAKLSGLVKSIIDEDDFEEVSEIPLPRVRAIVLHKVIEFCEHYSFEPMAEIEKPLKSQNMADVVQQWYADYVNVEQGLLFELIMAANYMDIQPLLDLTCATVASMIMGKTPEEIRIKFNISNDFSPEEEARVREENKWCEEDSL